MRSWLLVLVAVAWCACAPGCGPWGMVDGGGPDASAGWSTARALPRGPRQETAVVTLADEIVVVGGFTRTLGSVSHTMVRWVDAYDPALDVWRELPDFPTELHHANVAVVDGELYVLGFLGASFAADGRGFRLTASGWVPVARMPAGSERGAAGVAVVDGDVWIVGGYRLGAVTQVSRYDPVGDEWSPGVALPAALDHLLAFASDGQVLVVGGRSTALAAHTSATWAWDATLASWVARAPMPTSRAGCAGAVYDGELFVFGGEGAPGGTGVFDAVEAFDPLANTWRELDPLPVPVHGLGAVAVGGQIHLPGGGTTQGFDASDIHQVYRP